MTELGDCPLCGRKLVAGRSVNRHHLVPRSRNGRDTVALHRICHAAIHAALTEKELERRYNTIESLATTLSSTASSRGYDTSLMNSGYAPAGRGNPESETRSGGRPCSRSSN